MTRELDVLIRTLNVAIARRDLLATTVLRARIARIHRTERLAARRAA